MNPREVYPNAPLVSVAFELRHPESEPLSPKQRSAFKELLRDDFPVMRMQQTSTQTIEVGPTGVMPHVQSEEFPKYFDRQNKISVSLFKQSTVVETSQYPGWTEFQRILKSVCLARQEIVGIDGIERIGLRYIDEIRIPGDKSPDWQDYLDQSLLGPRAPKIVSLPRSQWQGVAAYGPEGGRSLVLRFASGEGFAIDPNNELRRKSPAYPGPFFLLDIDSFWIPESGIPEFSQHVLEKQTDILHAPVRDSFEELITDRLRDEVLRK